MAARLEGKSTCVPAGVTNGETTTAGLDTTFGIREKTAPNNLGNTGPHPIIDI